MVGAIAEWQRKVAILSIPGTDHLKKRENGYKDALAKFPEIQIVKIGNDQGSQVEAQKVSLAILQAFPDLAAFACVEAGGGQGAAVAVKQAGKVGQVRIVAMDRDEATLQAIDEGVIDASIGQRTYIMPDLALSDALRSAKRPHQFVHQWEQIHVNPLPPNIDTGSFVITKDNVALPPRAVESDSRPQGLESRL